MYQQSSRVWLVTLLVGFTIGAKPCAVLLADDWPQWRGPQRNAVSPEIDLLPSWPEGGPRTVWHASGLGQGYASVTISDGRVFTIGNHEEDVVCVALDAETGAQHWTCRIGTTSRNSCSTPTVDGDRLYALAPDGELVCLNAESGEFVWRRHLPNDFGGRMPGRGYGESPLVDGNWLVCTPGGPEAMLVALNKRTGAVVWKSKMPDIGPVGYDGAGFSSIVITQGAGIRQYIQLVGRGVIGVATDDGRFLWGYNSLANRTANIPTPVARGDLVFAANGYNTGSVLLKLVPAGARGVSAQEVYRLSGSRFQNHHGGVLLLGDYIYGGHGSNNGLPTCIELRSGRVKWKRRGPGVGSASVVCADGQLYFRYQNGIMALIEATAEGYRLNGTFQIPGAGGDSWAHPVIAHGRLYLREKNELWVYDLRGASALSLASPAPSPQVQDSILVALRESDVSIASVSAATSYDGSDNKRLYRYASGRSESNDSNQVLLISLDNRHLTPQGTFATELWERLTKLTLPFILNLAGTDVTDSAVKQLADLPSLVGLNLELCRSITDEGIEQLSRARHLRVLLLTGVGVTDKGLAHLRRMKTLLALDLEVCEQVTDAGCETLGSMKQLRALVLKKAGFESIRITATGVGHLRNLSELELLNLYGNHIDDDGLVHLERMTRLRELNLSLLPITDRGLIHLHPLRELQHLELLYSTGFAGPIITDNGLEPLQTLVKLKTLNLIGAPITDRSLKRLMGLKQLTRLKLVNTGISRNGLRELKTALPHCEIIR